MILDPATGDGRLIPGFRPHPDLIEQVASSPTHVVALRALSPREYWVWDEAAGDERLAQRPAGSLDTPGRILGFSDTDALIHGSTTVMPTTRLMRLPLAAGDVATIADPPFSDRIRQSQVFRGNLLLAMHNQHFQHHSSIPASNPLQGVRLADASYIQGPHMPGDIHFLGDVGNWLVARFDDSTSASLVRIGENVTFEFVHSFPVGATIDRADPSDALDGRAAFVVRNAAGEATLWESDGTPEGTRNLAPGHSWPIAPTGLALLPTGVLIVVPAADLGWEPWLVPFGDGDPALLVDIHPGVGSSDPMHLLRVGNRAFFSASDGIHGREPWVTDGTPEGTRMLRDVMPGARSSFPHGFFDTGRGVVLFVATDAEAGAELWAVTERGRRTWRVADIDPGPHGSEPRDFAITDQAVYFTAHDAEFGRELWRLPFASLDHLLPGDVWVLE
jgi:ELWxxDGT repeat protein